MGSSEVASPEIGCALISLYSFCTQNLRSVKQNYIHECRANSSTDICSEGRSWPGQSNRQISGFKAIALEQHVDSSGCIFHRRGPCAGQIICRAGDPIVVSLDTWRWWPLVLCARLWNR